MVGTVWKTVPAFCRRGVLTRVSAVCGHFPDSETPPGQDRNAEGNDFGAAED
jgi:hypothetical protein